MCSTYLLYVIFHSFLCKLYCNTSTTHNGNSEPLPRYSDTRSIGCFNAFTCLYIRICWRRQCRCYRRQRSVGYKLLAKLKRMLSMRTNCKFKWFYDRCVCVRVCESRERWTSNANLKPEWNSWKSEKGPQRRSKNKRKHTQASVCTRREWEEIIFSACLSNVFVLHKSSKKLYFYGHFVCCAFSFIPTDLMCV